MWHCGILERSCIGSEIVLQYCKNCLYTLLILKRMLKKYTSSKIAPLEKIHLLVLQLLLRVLRLPEVYRVGSKGISIKFIFYFQFIDSNMY